MRLITRTLIVAAALTTAHRTVSAQAAHSRPTSMIAIDPLGIPWDLFQLELEKATGPGTSLGLLGSYTDIDNQRNSTVDLKVRYYPSEEVLNRLSVGLSGGYTRFSRLAYDPSVGMESRQVLEAPTLGVLVDYNFIHGSSRRFVVGTGVGAKRILASATERRRLNLDRAYMTARFVIGIAF